MIFYQENEDVKTFYNLYHTEIVNYLGGTIAIYAHDQ